MYDAKEAITFEKMNPNLIILRSYEESTYGVTTEIFYNPDDNCYYAKGYFGAGKGDLRSYIKMDSDPIKREKFIEKISESMLKSGGKETIHNKKY